MKNTRVARSHYVADVAVHKLAEDASKAQTSAKCDTLYLYSLFAVGSAVSDDEDK